MYKYMDSHFSSFKVSPSYIDWNKVICGRILNWLRQLTFVFFRKKPEERDWYKIFANFQSRRSPVKWVRSHRLQKVMYMASWSMFYTHNSRWLNPFLEHDHISSGLIFDLVWEMFILIKEKCNRMSQACCAFSKTITKSLGLSNVLNIKI